MVLRVISISHQDMKWNLTCYFMSCVGVLPKHIFDLYDDFLYNVFVVTKAGSVI